MDGVTSTSDHPYLTPEGWKRAEEIVPGDLLCVWESIPDALPETTASDVFEGMPLRALLENAGGERDAKSAAAAFCKYAGATRRGDAGATGGLRTQMLADNEAARAQAGDSRRERPWAHVAGVPSGECDWLATARGSNWVPAAQGRSADELQIGLGRAISEAGNRGRRTQPRHVGASSARLPQGCMARWSRVDRVEVHERGGVGQYEEVCPDGLVHDIQTESGVFFAGGRLVANCGTYKPELLQFLVESCVTPSQVKWFGNGGRGLAMIGTPGLTEGDYWHRVCQGEFGGSVHHATVHDNPHIPNAEGYLEHVLKSYSWTRSTPRFRREYMGQFCVESDSLCYGGSWDKVVLPQSSVPDGGYTILGLDLGASVSPSAWVVLRITRELVGTEWQWITHVIHAETATTLTVHDVAAITGNLRKRFGIQKMRGDSAGLGAMTLETLRTKFNGLPVESAPKAGQKVARIWLMASMLATGRLRVYEGAAPLIEEMLSVPWNDSRDDHHQSFSDHACDAAHYAIECAQQWSKENSPKGPEVGSDEWRREEMAKHKKSAINRGQHGDDY